MSNLTDVLNKYGGQMISAMKQILIDNNKGDSEFIKTLNYKVVEDIDDIDVEFIMEDCAKWIDEGRGPGKQPPLEAIQDWTSRKGIPESAAFAIAKSIGRFGIPPTNFLSPIRDSQQELLSLIEVASAEDLADFIRKNNK